MKIRTQSAVLNKLLILASMVSFASTSMAAFLDANGHYMMRAETRTAPAMSGRTGMYQAIDQNFRLEGEVRLNDQSSFFVEFRIFDDPRRAYLGDTPQPAECSSRRGSSSSSCKGRHQSTGEPGYAPYTPKITKAYIKYGFDYCLLEAGRRGRDWGLGMLLDSGRDPFDTAMSVYDGVTCDINMQKSQNLGISFGYDKLAETGTFVYSPYDNPSEPSNDAEKQLDAEYDAKTASTVFGENMKGDDLDQYYFALKYGNKQNSSGSDIRYEAGIYFANVLSSKSKSGIDSATDLKYLDIYYNLYFKNLTFKNEFLSRNGKTSDPNFARLGGIVDYEQGYHNDVQSFSLAGIVEWTLSKSGSVVGPEEYKEGNASRHMLYLDYALAPGSSRGYFSSKDAAGAIITDESANQIARANNEYKGEKTSATAFHQNFKPALIFFNGRPQNDNLYIDGVFDPTRIMNVNLFGFAYRYEDLDSGNFEAKIITGSLNEAMPQAVRDYYLSQADSYRRPIGFYGKELGYELDLKYWKTINRQVDLGLATAYTLPGNAWQTLEGETPKNNFLIQSYVSLSF